MDKTINKMTNTPKDVSILLVEDNKEDIQIITNFINQSKRLNGTIQVVDSIKKANTIITTPMVFFCTVSLLYINGNTFFCLCAPKENQRSFDYI